MTPLPEQAKEALERCVTSGAWSYDSTNNAIYAGEAEVIVVYEGGLQFRGDGPIIALAPDLARAVLAAEELAKEAGYLETAEMLGDYERPMVSLPKSVVDDILKALAAYRKTTGGEA